MTSFPFLELQTDHLSPSQIQTLKVTISQDAEFFINNSSRRYLLRRAEYVELPPEITFKPGHAYVVAGHYLKDEQDVLVYLIYDDLPQDRRDNTEENIQTVLKTCMPIGTAIYLFPENTVKAGGADD